jgi:hypothetical protein
MIYITMESAVFEDSINMVGISSFISSDGSADIREIERSIVEQEEIQAISETKNEDMVSEFRKRIATMESSVGIPFGDNEGGSLFRVDNPEPEEQDDLPRSSLFNDPSSTRQMPHVPPTYTDPHLNRMSHEQVKQRELQNALDSINITPSESIESFNLDREKQKDKKEMLLGQIDLLRQSLDDEGRKTDDIPPVTMENTFEEVESVYTQLRYRNDHVRYCSVANEFAQTFAYGLEWAFDGEKDYFGFRPDMTGWDATLNIKMRHLSYETSSMVSETMNSYNLGNFWRLMLELVPSAILHSKMRKNKKGRSDTRPSDNDIAGSIGKIRDMDDL